MVATFCSAVIVMTPSLPRPCRTTRRLNLVGPPRDRKIHTTAHPHQASLLFGPPRRSRSRDAVRVRAPSTHRGGDSDRWRTLFQALTPSPASAVAVAAHANEKQEAAFPSRIRTTLRWLGARVWFRSASRFGRGLRRSVGDFVTGGCRCRVGHG